MKYSDLQLGDVLVSAWLSEALDAFDDALIFDAYNAYILLSREGDRMMFFRCGSGEAYWSDNVAQSVVDENQWALLHKVEA